MSSLLSAFDRRRSIIGIITMFCIIGSGFSADYKTRYDADEAVLEKLVQRRMGAWVNFQLEAIRKRYPSRKEDLAYLNAMYMPSATQRIESLKKITEASARYGEAQLALAGAFRKPEERVVPARNAYRALKGDKSKVEKATHAQRLLITVLVEIGSKESIAEALKIIKASTGGDKRYMEYQSARLQLILADNAKEENGKLTDAQATMVKGVISALIKGDLFWQNDYIAMLGYCEMAHAYVLLNKPKQAYKQLRAPFKMMAEMTNTFPKEMRIHSPEIPAKYYLAKASVQLYRMVKSGAEKPPKVPNPKGDGYIQLSKEKGMAYYLVKAFNIYQYELQERYINKSRLSKKALLDADKLRKIMIAEGLKPPAPKQDQVQRIAWEKATELYSDGKFAEAIEQFELAGKDRSGRYRAEKSLDCLFYLAICYARTDQFDKAIERGKTATLNFKNEERAWDALYITGTEALKAAAAVRGKDEEKYAAYKKIASDMFNFIVDKNKSYSKAEGAIYQRGNDLWAEAVEVGKQKSKAQVDLDKAIKSNANSTEIKRLTGERDKALENMKNAYMEAAKPFKLLLENYSSSKYVPKATHRLAWINLIVQNKEEAIKYFKMYCEKDSTPTPEYIDSKYWMANTHYTEDNREEAIKLFDEVIKLTDPKAKKYVLPEKGAANAEKRIMKSRRKSLALRPWVYVQWGEELIDQAASMGEDVDELNTLIKNYDATIAEAVKDKKETVNLTLANTPNIPKKASKVFQPGKLPEDYAFKSFFLRASSKVDLVKVLPDDVSVRMKEGLLWVTKNHDTIGEIGGKGFDVTLDNAAVYWKGQGRKIACYRAGKLVCVYDPDNVESRPAKEGEAPETIELPPLSQTLTIKEATLRHFFMIKQRDANLQRIDKVREEGLKLQNKALDDLRSYVDTYKKDKDYSPMSLLQIAKIYVGQEKFGDATQALSDLQKRYPASSAAKQAPIYYFRTIMNALKKEKDDQKRIALQKKANTQAESIQKSIKTLSLGNVKLLAFRLFDKNEFNEDTNMSPGLTAAALDEVMRRAEKDESLGKLRERALYMKALSLYIKKDYAAADKQLVVLLGENEKTAYLFKALLLRCKALRRMKKVKESIGEANKVIRKTSASKERFKEEYWAGVLEMCRTLLTKKEAGARSAKLWLGQCIALDADDKDLQWIREAAFYELVRTYFILDENTQAEKVRSDYLLSYPGGPWRRKINQLN